MKAARDEEEARLLKPEPKPRAPSPSRGAGLLGVSPSLLAGAAFCAASGSMTLLNKAALSSFNFDAPNCLLLFQCALTVALVRAAAAAGVVRVEPLSWPLVRAWYPVNAVFVSMIATSFWALRDLGVPMSTVLKNMTNLFIVGAEFFLYGRVYSRGIWACMALMVASALAGGYTDLHFSAAGYFWQVVNSGFTAAYTLSLKVAMERVRAYTSTGDKLDEWSLVLLNNLLSLPLLAGLAVARGEAATLLSQPDLTNPAFLAVATLSGVFAFAISFSVLWFLSTTTPTTFSLVGSLNKIPVSVLGLLLFERTWSASNLASVLLGLAAGAAFVKAKSGG